MDDVTAAQLAAIQAVLDSARPVGGGQRGIEIGVLRDFARDEPELAAVACQVWLKLAEESKGYATLAAALADEYESVFDDDTLSVIVREHYAGLGQPVLELRYQAPAEPVTPLHLAVPEDLLERCEIYPVLKAFSHRHLPDGQSVSRLAKLGGLFYLTFPIPVSDPRRVWQDPSVRRYVRALADAMPYFPFYLATDPRLGMFEVYFGSLIEPGLFEDGTFDLTKDEIFAVVGPALLATLRFGDAVGTDGEACVRALLACLPPAAADFVVGVLREMERDLQQGSASQ
jgi:hypothetical protein